MRNYKFELSHEFLSYMLYSKSKMRTGKDRQTLYSLSTNESRSGQSFGGIKNEFKTILNSMFLFLFRYFSEIEHYIGEYLKIQVSLEFCS